MGALIYIDDSGVRVYLTWKMNPSRTLIYKDNTKRSLFVDHYDSHCVLYSWKLGRLEWRLLCGFDSIFLTIPF